ncbi:MULTISPECIES: M15 family metallopeptidase [Microbacterium]|uniref:M15 family metallopeptidase n=1 Tax=Microbacterium TaxID=33882 RepID=UPI00217E8023|nr:MULTISPECIES: D-alanyl-D-alanine carboxypeptidase family protein [Microbacterium]UWF77699.1 D-alanyl-D-alanine carboxypeptidase family protein [Microbacterium neungamense]WCM55868.1 D-alanyl-D-alanine carboxypeptidase family protein [Microbacterium sp. EF45047]
MPVTQPRHAASRPAALSVAVPLGLLFTAAASLGALAAAPVAEPVTPPVPAAALRLPAPDVAQQPVADPCGDAGVQAALASGDDEAAIAAFGGGEAFRAAVTTGNAPCISLSDPARLWVVVNKGRPLSPVDFVPASLQPYQVRSTSPSDDVRPEVAQALAAMAAASQGAGAGVLGANNGYRSYGLQQSTYADYVRDLGQQEADAGSARPGHSEHQTGLAVDLVACDDGCGGLDDFGGTAQGRWVAEHAWEFGFIVRYESGATGTTGYAPEPWHLRYIGPQLAAAYHHGGYRSLEDFFGLPPAPDYPF